MTSGTTLEIENYTAAKEGDFAMGQAYLEPGAGIVLIVVLVLLYVLCNPIPGPVDDAIVATVGGYQALKRL